MRKVLKHRCESTINAISHNYLKIDTISSPFSAKSKLAFEKGKNSE